MIRDDILQLLLGKGDKQVAIRCDTYEQRQAIFDAMTELGYIVDNHYAQKKYSADKWPYLGIYDIEDSVLHFSLWGTPYDLDGVFSFEEAIIEVLEDDDFSMEEIL